ncbi:hypothetical protein AB1E19_002080 [Capra hircus]
MKRLRPLPTVIVIRTCLPQRRSRDFRVVVLGSAGVGKSALVQRKQTLEELKPLYELIRQLKGNNPQKCPVILVGNKCDESRREELFQLLINFEKKPAAAAAAAAPAGAQPPQKKSQIPKTAEKLLGERTRIVKIMDIGGGEEKRNRMHFTDGSWMDFRD